MSESFGRVRGYTNSTWKGVEPAPSVDIPAQTPIEPTEWHDAGPLTVIIPTDVYNNLVKRIEALENRTLVDEHIALVRRVESIESQVYGDDND